MSGETCLRSLIQPRCSILGLEREKESGLLSFQVIFLKFNYYNTTRLIHYSSLLIQKSLKIWYCGLSQAFSVCRCHETLLMWSGIHMFYMQREQVSVHLALSALLSKGDGEFGSSNTQVVQASKFQGRLVVGVGVSEDDPEGRLLDSLNVGALLLCYRAMPHYTAVFQHASNEKNEYFHHLLSW